MRVATHERLDALRLGIELIAFEVNAITPPVAAAAAFADVTSAQVQARTTVEQARTYRAQTLPSAQGNAFRIRAAAVAAGRQLTTQAGAVAATFLALAAEHRANPALLETRLRAERFELIFPQLKAVTVLPLTAGSTFSSILSMTPSLPGSAELDDLAARQPRSSKPALTSIHLRALLVAVGVPFLGIAKLLGRLRQAQAEFYALWL